MTLGTPIKGPGGVLRWPEAGPRDVEPTPAPRKADTSKVRQLRRALDAEHLKCIEHERHIRSLKIALASALGSPHADRWKGLICDDCGCLCKPREDCPMCLWNHYSEQERKTA